MRRLLLVVVVVVVVVVSSAVARKRCSYSCYRRSCRSGGLFGLWRRCRTVRHTCYKPCPAVNGGWTSFKVTSRGSCSVTCGVGTRTVVKTRTCTSPSPSNGGRPCSGSPSVTTSQTCRMRPCPVDGKWTAFKVTYRGSCSVTCGVGSRRVVKTRTCIGPKYGGRPCSGSKSVATSQTCRMRPCPVDGKWTAFKVTYRGSCSVTCGVGSRRVVKTRTCIGPKYGGRPCSGSKSVATSQTCRMRPCPVDGKWTAFKVTSRGSCSVTCGVGSWRVVKTRACIGPKYGGQPCSGSKSVATSQTCRMRPCPVDGKWTAFKVTSRGSCSVTCGVGSRRVVKTRTCIGPKYGGRPCSGSKSVATSQTCKMPLCPVDGKWTAFKVTSRGSCSVTCGVGSRRVVKTRACIGPKYGGRPCSGSMSVTTSQTCKMPLCPVNGGWTGFKVVYRGSCSVTCGVGTQRVDKTRTCTNPSPQNGGRSCSGPSSVTTTLTCKQPSCPVDGRWTLFRNMSRTNCSVTCGNGTMNVTQTRQCSNPAPQYGGADCKGQNSRLITQPCTMGPCPSSETTTAGSDTGTTSASGSDTGTTSASGSYTGSTSAPVSGTGTTSASGSNTGRTSASGSNTGTTSGSGPDTGATSASGSGSGTTSASGSDTGATSASGAGSGTTSASNTTAGGCVEGTLSAVTGNCRLFRLCTNGRTVEMPCAPGTLFDVTIKGCNHAADAVCAG